MSQVQHGFMVLHDAEDLYRILQLSPSKTIPHNSKDEEVCYTVFVVPQIGNIPALIAPHYHQFQSDADLLKQV